MANAKKNKSPIELITKSKAFQNINKQLNNTIGQSNLSLYGTDRTSDIETLNSQFSEILNSGMKSITSKENGDVTSFLSKLVSKDRKISAMDEMFDNQFSGISGNDVSAMQSFISEAYKNRFVEQADLHQVSSQLIELSESILIVRDAIISADIVEGRMSRTLTFENLDDEHESNYIPIVEQMEKKFKLLEKIKNFIVPKTLEYGSYYAYTVPYSKIFNDFISDRSRNFGYRHGSRSYHESTKTLFEFVTESSTEENNLIQNENKKIPFSKTVFLENAYEKYVEASLSEFERDAKNVGNEFQIPDKNEFAKDVEHLLNNVTVCNSDIPIPILEEGIESMEYFKESCITEKKEDGLFHKGIKSTDGIIISKDSKSKKENFDDISDCYIKLIEPTRILPLKIMNTTIGYYYVCDEDIVPSAGMISSTMYNTKFKQSTKEYTIIDAISEQLVQSFDKKFLKNNIKFKEIIAETLTYYNINEKKLKFQFIPVEYMQEFKIDEDEDGNGQSMMKKSLFYAKLYLMLLLFKIMSIILYSNDTKVNYVKQSGLDKNVANKIQDIIRIKQNRQINIMDLFNYSTLVNKVGAGNEIYYPIGRSGDRGVETEILSGQDIQLNTELLEMLKNSYILGTGVPATIINYLNEIEFAKVAEQNNTKFNGRVVNYQLDFNPSLTEWYKKIMSWSTNIEADKIENFSFTLQPPKMTSSTAKQELIDTHTRNSEYIISLFFPEPESEPEAVREFKIKLAEVQLPMLNIKELEKMADNARIYATEKKLTPNPNGDTTEDDLGLEGLE